MYDLSSGLNGLLPFILLPFYCSSLEIGYFGWGCDRADEELTNLEIDRLLRSPSPDRIMAIRAAMIQGRTNQNIHELTRIDLWFLAKLRNIIDLQVNKLNGKKLSELDSLTLFTRSSRAFMSIL